LHNLTLLAPPAVLHSLIAPLLVVRIRGAKLRFNVL